MKHCTCLLFATTKNSTDSKWMPWELGLKDGQNGLVAILPVVQDKTERYSGQEYLGIYPYIDIHKDNTRAGPFLWVNETAEHYVKFDSWLNGDAPTKH